MRFRYIDLTALIFSLSCVPLLFLSSLPSTIVWFAMSLLLLLITALYRLNLNLHLFFSAIFLLGFLWSTASAKQYLDNVSTYVDKELLVTAKVESINTVHQNKQSDIQKQYIQFTLLSVNKEPVKPLPIIVYWDKEPQPLAGQIWKLNLNMQVVHSYLNEGGFDSQRFAMTNKRLLTAKLRKFELIDNQMNFRQKIVNQALPYIQLFPYQDIMLALAFGDRSQLSNDNRRLMMQTGTTHLMAISGMHIILVFFVGSLIAKGGLILLPIRYMHYNIPVVAGLSFAIFYAWLSGFNPPTLRAILALLIWVLLRYKNGQLSAWQKVNRIIAILLFIDPLMILSESFWLSCYAIVCLIFISEWIPLPHFMLSKKRWYPVRLLHLQLGLSLLLLPMQFYIFQGTSGSALLANFIAIPLISLFSFPTILCGLIFSILGFFHLSLWFWFVAEQSLEWLFWGLAGLSGWWYTVPSNFYALSFIGWLSIIILRTGYWRQSYITVLIIILILIAPLFKIKEYDWRLDMLDVGHGLAMVIHNGSSAILYDTGAKWENGSAAERVILPFLKWHNIEVEGIIISHEHLDHVGGLDAILQSYPNAWLMSSSLKLNNDYKCIDGKIIQWKQLTFTVLWPKKLVGYAENENSCVVRVTDGQFSILLTGDLERQQEYQLVSNLHEKLATTFLQIPHHGSKTSSSYPFLHYVSPKFSFASASRYNPWRLPSNQVLSRYSELKLPYYVTAKSSQISLFFTQTGWQIKTMREKIKPRWYHDWFGELPSY